MAAANLVIPPNIFGSDQKAAEYEGAHPVRKYIPGPHFAPSCGHRYMSGRLQHISILDEELTR